MLENVFIKGFIWDFYKKTKNLQLKKLYVTIKNINFLMIFTDPPEITVETPIVFSGEGQEAMLVCIVHGEKLPDVSK